MTGAPLAAVVDSPYRETSKYLLQVLHTRYSFMEHLKVSTHTVWRETFEGENFHKFRDFSAIHGSFLHEILGMPHPLCDQF